MKKRDTNASNIIRENLEYLMLILGIVSLALYQSKYIDDYIDYKFLLDTGQ